MQTSEPQLDLVPCDSSETQPVVVTARPVGECRTAVRRKAPALRRLAADVIDRIIPLPFLVPLFWPWAIVCVSYDLLADSRGASLGKRLMGLKTVVVSPKPERDGSACTLGRSLLRNGLWCAARLCYSSVFLAPVGITYDVVEFLMASCSPSGRRLGDLLAGTQVVALEQEGGAVR